MTGLYRQASWAPRTATTRDRGGGGGVGAVDLGLVEGTMASEPCTLPTASMGGGAGGGGEGGGGTRSRPSAQRSTLLAGSSRAAEGSGSDAETSSSASSPKERHTVWERGPGEMRREVQYAQHYPHAPRVQERRFRSLGLGSASPPPIDRLSPSHPTPAPHARAASSALWICEWPRADW